MLQMPQGYKEQTAFVGGFEQLPAGGYVCKVLGVKTEEKEYGVRLSIMFDIIEADARVIDKSYRSYFNTLYQSRKLSDASAKWPASGIHHISLPNKVTEKKEQNMIGFFKGFIEAVKSSNPGFVCGFDTGNSFDEQTLKGMMFGAIFGREQYQDNQGELKWGIHVAMVRSVETIKTGDYKIPDDKPLANTSGFNPANAGYGAAPMPDISQYEMLDVNPATDDGLPF